MKVKSKYKNSIARLPFGKALKPVALSELSETECKRFYNLGFTEYFEDLTTKSKKKDDKNNKRSNSSRLSDTDGESDSE